ncbi:MAG: hypothetical protein LBI36_05195 [Oscillospiraceae bacterium]|nr:hypothetical protein [Oscillospiraceae bacterium]
MNTMTAEQALEAGKELTLLVKSLELSPEVSFPRMYCSTPKTTGFLSSCNPATLQR